MQLIAIGLNHQTAPLSIREKLAFAAEVLPGAIRELSQVQAVHEALILSTCNRTEVYAFGDTDKIIQWIADFHGLSIAEISPYLYILNNKKTIQHAFRVSCGLDSMVLGEPQILGQLKNAVRIAQQEQSLGPHLNMLFQRTFSVAKDIRSNTAVGENSVSMAAASVKMAEQIFPNISDLNVLFIGAGEMIELVATYFSAKYPKKITVANRTIGRAEELTQKIGLNTQAIVLSELPNIIHDYDIIVSSTASQLPIVGKGIIEQALKKRRYNPMFLLDLAVPRDIEPQVSELSDVFLYTVDDMVNIVKSGKDARKTAAKQAEHLIENKVEEYIEWQKSRETVPLIRELRENSEQARLHVLNHAQKLLQKGLPAEEVLERLSIQLTNKLIHHPTKALHDEKNTEQDLVKAIVEIYQLEN